MTSQNHQPFSSKSFVNQKKAEKNPLPSKRRRVVNFSQSVTPAYWLTFSVSICRFSTCNLHGLHSREGITATVNDVRIQQYCSSNFPLQTNRPDSGPHHHPDVWIEAGSVRFGPVYIEGSLSGHSVMSQEAQLKQHLFLQKHDHKTHRYILTYIQKLSKIWEKA